MLAEDDSEPDVKGNFTNQLQFRLKTFTRIQTSITKDSIDSHLTLSYFLSTEEIIVVDDIPEPENLSTKPEDLSRSAEKRKLSCSPRSFSPVEPAKTQSPAHSPLRPEEYPRLAQSSYYNSRYIVRDTTPPLGVTPYPVAKKARVEVIQHESTSLPPRCSPPLPHFMANKSPLESSVLNIKMEQHHMEPLPYNGASWPMFPPYNPSMYYGYPGVINPEMHFPHYPVPGFPSASPENASVSPQSHSAALTCSPLPRPIARSYPQWVSLPDHGGLSPTSSLGSSSLRSPPPNMAEDLSSPGSDSGRSSAGSTSAGSTILSQKREKLGKVSPVTSSTTGVSASATRYQCRDCGKSYSTHSGLTKHQQFHCTAAEGQLKKTFTCKDCGKVYVSLGALKMHIRTHTLPCRCNLCGKAFSRPWLLQGHIRTHTGEKPFSCQHCKRAFADRSNLRAHLQTHSDIKKYSCSSCSKTFSRMSLLLKHQESGCPGISGPIGYSC